MLMAVTVYCLLFSVYCFLLFVPAGSAAEDVILRASVTPKDDIWVGQKVALQVDVLAKDGWGQIKNVRDVEIPGALALRVQTQGMRISESIEGASYTGQRYELLLYPQRGGAIIVPAVPVDIEIKAWGGGVGRETRRMKTPPLEFQVQTPPGTSNFGGLISTTELSLEQTWEPDSGDFKVGDAIKRRVVVEAEGVAGMAFAPLEYVPIPGVGSYPSEPAVTDEVDRGELVRGTRVESVTYVLQEPGPVVFPGLERSWWDLERKTLMRASVPSLSIEVAPNLAAAGGPTDRSPQSSRFPRILLAVAGISVLVVGILFRARQATVIARIRAWRAAWDDREYAYFKRILRATRSDDSAATMTALMAWLDRRAPGSEVGSLEQFLSGADIPELTRQVRVLEGKVYGDGRDASLSLWSAKTFCRLIRAGRRRVEGGSRSKNLKQTSVLPMLNP